MKKIIDYVNQDVAIQIKETHNFLVQLAEELF